MRLIYLAGPYTDKDKKIVQQRIDWLADAVAYFMTTAPDLYVFSPILQCFYVARQHELPHDFQFWAQRDFFMIKKSAAMWVLMLPGWKDSFGVSQEIEYAESIGRDVFYVNQDLAEYVVMDARPIDTLPSNN